MRRGGIRGFESSWKVDAEASAFLDIMCMIEKGKNMKHIDFKQRIRMRRKAEAKIIGQNRFGFYVDQELLKYKYFKGSKISRREWKKMACDNFEGMPNSQMEWEKGIRKTYQSYSIMELKEFSAYLDYSISSGITTNSMNAIVSSVIASSILSAVFSQLLSANLKLENPASLVGWLVVLIFGIGFIVWFATWIVFYLMNDREINNTFLRDYKKVIDSMLKRKTDCARLNKK